MPSKRLLYRVVAFNLAVITITVIISNHLNQLEYQFEEEGFITYFSVAQLLIVSFITYKIFQVRTQSTATTNQSPAAIWKIISIGFLFLAFDDLLAIHELADKWIHAVLQIKETGWSDRLDDVIVGFYGLLALGVLYVYRQELKKYSALFPIAATAFVLLFAMVGIDILTNRDDVLWMFFSRKYVLNIKSWIFIVEESLKLLSEACLIVVAYGCLQVAKRLALKLSSESQTTDQALARSLSSQSLKK